jgi:hypothetical protein
MSRRRSATRSRSRGKTDHRVGPRLAASSVPSLQKQAWIRHHVAAQSLGIADETFSRWPARGAKQREGVFRQFRQNVEWAQAQSRLIAETQVYDSPRQTPKQMNSTTVSLTCSSLASRFRRGRQFVILLERSPKQNRNSSPSGYPAFPLPGLRVSYSFRVGN